MVSIQSHEIDSSQTFPIDVAPQLVVQLPLLLFQVQLLHPVGTETADAQLGRARTGMGPGSRAVSPPLALRDHELGLFSH